jgi:hypothetical protein
VRCLLLLASHCCRSVLSQISPKGRPLLCDTSNSVRHTSFPPSLQATGCASVHATDATNLHLNLDTLCRRQRSRYPCPPHPRNPRYWTLWQIIFGPLVCLGFPRPLTLFTPDVSCRPSQRATPIFRITRLRQYRRLRSDREADTNKGHTGSAMTGIIRRCSNLFVVRHKGRTIFFGPTERSPLVLVPSDSTDNAILRGVGGLCNAVFRRTSF